MLVLNSKENKRPWKQKDFDNKNYAYLLTYFSTATSATTALSKTKKKLNQEGNATATASERYAAIHIKILITEVNKPTQNQR